MKRSFIGRGPISLSSTPSWAPRVREGTIDTVYRRQFGRIGAQPASTTTKEPSRRGAGACLEAGQRQGVADSSVRPVADRRFLRAHGPRPHCPRTYRSTASPCGPHLSRAPIVDQITAGEDGDKVTLHEANGGVFAFAAGRRPFVEDCRSFAKVGRREEEREAAIRSPMDGERMVVVAVERARTVESVQVSRGRGDEDGARLVRPHAGVVSDPPPPIGREVEMGRRSCGSRADGARGGGENRDARNRTANKRGRRWSMARLGRAVRRHPEEPQAQRRPSSRVWRRGDQSSQAAPGA